MTFPDLSGHETKWPWLLPPHMHIGPCRPVCEEAISILQKADIWGCTWGTTLSKGTIYGMLTTIQPVWDECIRLTHWKTCEANKQTPATTSDSISGPWLTKAYMLAFSSHLSLTAILNLEVALIWESKMTSLPCIASDCYIAEWKLEQHAANWQRLFYHYYHACYKITSRELTVSQGIPGVAWTL